MTVTVFVPIQLEIEGKDKFKEIQEQIKIISRIVKMSELESDPNFMPDLIADSDIIEEN